MNVKPTITISLKKHLADYCRHEFTEDENGHIIINRKHDIGKLINSQISVSVVPVSQFINKDKVVFILPINRYSDLLNKYLFVSKWSEQQINDYIESLFHLRCREMFIEGRLKGLQQKIIIESILQHYNIKETAISYEAVKKNDYRTNRFLRKKIAKELLRSE